MEAYRKENVEVVGDLKRRSHSYRRSILCILHNYLVAWREAADDASLSNQGQ